MTTSKRILNLLIILFTCLNIPQTVIAVDQLIPEIGSKAPNIILNGTDTNNNEKEWNLDTQNRSWKIVYFYPKDFTSGCTIEARGFQQMNKEFKEKDAEIYGISADDINQHEGFCSDIGLDYPLLSDPEGRVSKSFGSWKEPYSLRNTFLIDKNGIIRQRWLAVKPSRHAEQVMAELTRLSMLEL